MFRAKAYKQGFYVGMNIAFFISKKIPFVRLQ